ncbi:UNC-50 [Lipomyces oligophaga]|uniref:UNC-50 n=1 Tax=Lipomyces oligophaga TaxID=45792 RepID=UPI0034CFC2B9
MTVLPINEDEDPVSSRVHPAAFSSPPSPTSSISSARRHARFRGGQALYNNNSVSMRIPVVLRRLLKPPTLDFETAIWEVCYLFIAPKKVYRQIYYRIETKNSWARDDPSFVILLSGFLLLTAVAWGVAYSPGFLSIVELMFDIVLVDFLLVGAIISTIAYFAIPRFLRQRQTRGVMAMAQQDSTLEWAYCFDVHCNSFLIIWFALYVLQFVMLPIIIKDNWLSLFLGNTLFFAAISYYIVITYLGYTILPFLERTELLLLPIIPVSILYVISLFGYNVSRHAVEFYFS